MNAKALRKISYGLYIVSSRLGDKLNGQIANTVFQVTSEPPKVAVCINKENFTHECIRSSWAFSVSVLRKEAPMTLIGRFGFMSGRDLNKFEGISYKIGKTGAPIVLDESVAYMEFIVTSTLDVGTHTIFVGELVDAELLSDEEVMTYDYYHKVKRGVSPEKAPTYMRER
ncbi:flavin reductase [Candidatus Korarchaeum cryptofilum]|jgi:ferric-chelate reductase [NAD(P)H]|uniref:Flavin reductase domain protein FMN-binding n=2 Tax=Candidatus Korarchaeum cryptofilum TaxID=498846 RepID=B1L3R9_KORCO|nr:flavin reductase family protein [Candidatus Korarchaeum cryptofilum]ACB07098.1 flavin reductase domain protein FMN-binding [Candidatus Korarchaeum cryptofilum OPF8]RSN67682.1 flavin reductase [Candidatus Korarchaeum cryptofilum]